MTDSIRRLRRAIAKGKVVPTPSKLARKRHKTTRQEDDREARAEIQIIPLGPIVEPRQK